MSQFLFDTDHLTLYQHRHPPLMRQYATFASGAIFVSPVNVEEALRGRLAALAGPRTGAARVRAYAHLVATVRLCLALPVVAFDQASENRFQQLLALRLRVGTQDVKIGPVALVNNLTVLTRNRRDFSRIPGLAIDDWSI